MTAAAKPKAMIQDNTRCIGCRACMVACKSWNNRPADHSDFFAGPGYQNPKDLDANTQIPESKVFLCNLRKKVRA